MPSCLITGASGFVGGNLARIARAAGWNVRALVRATSVVDDLKQLGVELVRGSLDDAASLSTAVAGVDVVFHVAGRTKAFKAEELMRDNAEGTRHLLAACAEQSPPPIVVMTSSLAAAGPGTFARPRRESDPPQPVSNYGRSKLAAEEVLREFADRVPASIVRPPIVFGPGDHASLAMYQGFRWFPVHATPGLRRWPVSVIYVEDLCRAMIDVALRGERVPGVAGVERSEPPGNGTKIGATGGFAALRPQPPAAAGQGIYHIAAERNLTYGEFGKLAGTAAGWLVLPLTLPVPIFWAAGILGELIGKARREACVVNFDKSRETAAAGWVGDDAKLRTQLDYRPSGSLEEQLAATIAWYRARGWM